MINEMRQTRYIYVEVGLCKFALAIPVVSYKEVLISDIQ
jgi:hypothetical protein